MTDRPTKLVKLQVSEAFYDELKAHCDAVYQWSGCRLSVPDLTCFLAACQLKGHCLICGHGPTLVPTWYQTGTKTVPKPDQANSDPQKHDLVPNWYQSGTKKRQKRPKSTNFGTKVGPKPDLQKNSSIQSESKSDSVQCVNIKKTLVENHASPPVESTSVKESKSDLKAQIGKLRERYLDQEVIDNLFGCLARENKTKRLSLGRQRSVLQELDRYTPQVVEKSVWALEGKYNRSGFTGDPLAYLRGILRNESKREAEGPPPDRNPSPPPQGPSETKKRVEAQKRAAAEADKKEKESYERWVSDCRAAYAAATPEQREQIDKEAAAVVEALPQLLREKSPEQNQRMALLKATAKLLGIKRR